mgnify:FL=1
MFIENFIHGVWYFLKQILIILRHPVVTIEAIKSIIDVNKIIESRKISVVFFDRIAIHYSFSKSIYDELVTLNQKALYVVCDKNHPKLRSDDSDYKQTFYLDKRYEAFLRFVNVPLIATPASHFPVLGKNKNTKIAHFFHSPNSMHFVYGDRAFDAYDIFFTVGPHHTKEFKLLEKLRTWKNKSSYPGGYPKIDILSRLSEDCFSEKIYKNTKRIAFAPSWLKTSILRTHGLSIIKNLIAEGYEVLLRPHIHSFDYDAEVISEIVNTFHDASFELDDGSSFDKLYNCDILISDWSGMAFEFAFSTCRPVVSVNVEGNRKILSINNTKISADAMEDVCRFEIGTVCTPQLTNESIRNIYEQGVHSWAHKIALVRGKYLYNFGNSSKVISLKIKDLSNSP